MEFRIADTFTASLARLTGEEQKAVKTAAFDLQVNPAHPSLQFHKLEKARDKRFWSVRVGSDVRLIVHRSDDSLLLCYVGHHDTAYQWAERRKIETHPKTGAAQIVEIRELTREVVVPAFVAPVARQERLFDAIPESELLGFGVPPEWVEAVRGVASEDEALEVAGHLPAEAAEAVLNIAAGLPAVASVRQTAREPELAFGRSFEHPDAQRRFKTIANEDELRAALEYPWEKWAIFLHPAQRAVVERVFNGPARISGSAGTGKTIVALHRAVHLARENASARVLLTTFSPALAALLRQKLRLLLGAEPRLGEQIECEALDAVALRPYAMDFGKPKIAERAVIEAMLRGQETKYSLQFLMAEWEHIVDAWQLRSWESYRDVNRLGRRTRLPEAARRRVWEVFSAVWAQLDARGLMTQNGIYARLAGRVLPYDFAVVDEAQDISVAQLKFLAGLAGERPNGLFFAGDLGQRIFRQPFSWKSLGVDIRGRSSTLRINYRTSRQIRQHADRLLGPEVSDVDGVTEARQTISLFEGAAPEIVVCGSESEECERVAEWLKARVADGVEPGEIAVFVRSEGQMGRTEAAVKAAGLEYAVLGEGEAPQAGRVVLATMHLAKGMEFRAVAVMACDDEVIPLQERIEEVSDPSDLDEVYDTERQLLYVACTRARDWLLVTGVEPASEFLDDLRAGAGAQGAGQGAS